MSKLDELNAMLGERGIRYMCVGCFTLWYSPDGTRWCYTEDGSVTHLQTITDITPEQAIAITMGS